MSTTTANIPLGQLSHCAANTRKTKASPGELAELVASITAHGLLENLVVSPAGGDVYEVVAGARRFDALHVLATAGDVPADFGVPCTVIENGADISEISLAENMVRVAMHPADQVEAFCRLHEQGSTVEEIANRFGITESLVTKRIRLGGVAPALLQAYRAGKMDLSALMAFTVTDDRKSQVAVFKQLDQGGRVSAWAVKRTLTDAKVSANTKIAHYVGLAAYEKAGGTVSRDLFAEDHEQGVYLDDPALVERLAAEKLEKTAAKLRKQWKWADVVLENIYEVTHGYDRVYAGPGAATEKERERLGEIETESAPLIVNEENPGPISEADAARLADLQGEYQKISDVIARREVWSPEQLAVGGCVVTIRHDGKGEVTKGFVKPEDREAARETKGRSRISDELSGRATRPRTPGRRPGSARRSPTTWRRSAPRWSRSSCSTTRRSRRICSPSGWPGTCCSTISYLGADALEVRGSASALRTASRMADKAFVKSSPGEPVLDTEGKKSPQEVRVDQGREGGGGYRRLPEVPEAEARDQGRGAGLLRCVDGEEPARGHGRPQRRPGARGGDCRDDARLQAGAAVEGSPLEPDLQADDARDPDRDGRRRTRGDTGRQEEGRAGRAHGAAVRQPLGRRVRADRQGQGARAGLDPDRLPAGGRGVDGRAELPTSPASGAGLSFRRKLSRVQFCFPTGWAEK